MIGEMDDDEFVDDSELSDDLYRSVDAFSSEDEDECAAHEHYENIEVHFERITNDLDFDNIVHEPRVSINDEDKGQLSPSRPPMRETGVTVDTAFKTVQSGMQRTTRTSNS